MARVVRARHTDHRRRPTRSRPVLASGTRPADGGVARRQRPQKKSVGVGADDGKRRGARHDAAAAERLQKACTAMFETEPIRTVAGLDTTADDLTGFQHIGASLSKLDDYGGCTAGA